MAPRTRANALVDRVYSSPAAQQQLEFKPRKRIVKARHSLDARWSSRQDTLTQMDFVNLQSSAFNDDEDDTLRKRKRRRTDGDVETPASTSHTQTLTQLEFVSSTPALMFKDEDQENMYHTLSAKDHSSKVVEIRGMGPPKTPVRRRPDEVPSSQSPMTPLSGHSQRYYGTRSPLTAMKLNTQRRIFSSAHTGAVFKQPRLEVKSSLVELDESLQVKREHSPRGHSIPKEHSEQQQRLVKLSRIRKQEIQDSDEEYLDDLDCNDNEGFQHTLLKPELETGPQLKQESCTEETIPDTFDEVIPETQIQEVDSSIILETQRKEPPSANSDSASHADRAAAHFQSDLTDTQDAEQQLHNTILQFTQSHVRVVTPDSELNPEEEQSTATPSLISPPFRPSQATTVADSSPPPLPPTRRRPQPLTIEAEDVEQQVIYPGDAEDIDDDDEDDDDDGLVTLIPDSPALPGRRTIGHGSRHHGTSSNTTQSLPPLPFSMASSQLLTRSQMLPESLMNDSVPLPPGLRWEEQEEEVFMVEDSELEE